METWNWVECKEYGVVQKKGRTLPFPFGFLFLETESGFGINWEKNPRETEEETGKGEKLAAKIRRSMHEARGGVDDDNPPPLIDYPSAPPLPAGLGQIVPWYYWIISLQTFRFVSNLSIKMGCFVTRFFFLALCSPKERIMPEASVTVIIAQPWNFGTGTEDDISLLYRSTARTTWPPIALFALANSKIYSELVRPLNMKVQLLASWVVKFSLS